MSARHFTEEVDTYVVLMLKLTDYRASARELPEGFELAGGERRAALRRQEKKLLQDKFEDWDIPYCAKLGGWRVDSPIFITRGEQLVGGVYLCDQNEFDQEATRGQLHYAFMDSQFQGLGIYSIIFRDAVRRARAWGLKEMYLNSDRYQLPEVYLRWGAKPWKEIQKASRVPRNAAGKFLRGARGQIRQVWRMFFSPCE